MTSNSRRAEIDRFVHLLMESELAIDYNPTVAVNSGSGRTRITWAAQPGIEKGIFRETFASMREYRGWLRGRSYSALLYDGAILQFTYDYFGNELIGHRLLYYPCPYVIELDLLLEEPILDILEVYSNPDEDSLRLRSPLRFDFDLNARQEGHPASHLTLLSEECRWAVIAPLSPGHFIRFIFKQFYPAIWDSIDFLQSWSQPLGDRTISQTEETFLHIACART